MPLNEDQTCVTCRFWDAGESDRAHLVYKECRANPPFSGPQLVGQFPLVQAETWCGRWTAMPKPKKDSEAP